MHVWNPAPIIHFTNWTDIVLWQHYILANKNKSVRYIEKIQTVLTASNSTAALYIMASFAILRNLYTIKLCYKNTFVDLCSQWKCQLSLTFNVIRSKLPFTLYSSAIETFVIGNNNTLSCICICLNKCWNAEFTSWNKMPTWMALNSRGQMVWHKTPENYK